jgi:serine kinase of HPr protein (carbohydrate metabolism regulator)
LDGRETIHASTVAIEGRAVMIVGPSGAGKSDLALRLIDRGATLVADDYTNLSRDGDTLVASAPATIAGRIEVRGLGIVETRHVDDVPVALTVDLGTDVPRMPEPSTMTIAGIAIRRVALNPRPASAPLLVELALRYALP